MLEALCRSAGTTLDSVHAEDGPPVTQRTSGLTTAIRELQWGVDHSPEVEEDQESYDLFKNDKPTTIT
jgi:hypothetical protein